MSLVASSRLPVLAFRLFRYALLLAGMTLIGLIVGVGCVIFPLAIPLGIVGVFGLLLLWVLPDRKSVSSQFPLYITRVFIFSIISIPAYYTLVFEGLPWISLRRVILFLFLGTIVLTLATSKDDRRAIAVTLKAWKPAAYCLGALVPLWGLSILGSSSPAESINGILNQNMVWLVCLAAAIMVFRDEALLRKALVLITACALIDFLIGGFEFYLKRPFLFYAVPANMREQLIATNGYLITLLIGSGLRNGIYRANSVFTGPLSWGEMAALVAPLGAYFVTESRAKPMRVYGVLIVISCFLSINFAGSRGAYIGFLASMVAYAMLWAIRNVRLQPKSLAGGMMLIMFGMGALGLVGSVFFVDRVNKTVLGNGQAQVSNQARQAQWQLAKPLVMARPVIGWGVGQAGGLVDYHPAPGAPGSLDSYAITLLVEMGIPGLVAYMGLFLFLIGRCAYCYVYSSGRHSPMAAALGCSLISYTLYRLTLSQIDNNYLVFTVAGITFRVLYLIRNDGQQTHNSSSDVPVRRPSPVPPRPVRVIEPAFSSTIPRASL